MANLIQLKQLNQTALSAFVLAIVEDHLDSTGAVYTANRALVTDSGGDVTVSAVTSTEVGYLSGVTSAIQTQLNTKLASTLTSAYVFVGNGSNTATGVAISGDITITNAGVTSIGTGVIVNTDINGSAAIALSKLAATTASRALVSDSSGFITASAVTSTELGYVSGVTSAIQTQFSSLGSTYLALAGGTMTGTITATHGTITADTPFLTGTQTRNAGGVVFEGIKLNVTVTAQAANSKLIDLQVGGASWFKLRADAKEIILDDYITIAYQFGQLVTGANIFAGGFVSVGGLLELGNSDDCHLRRNASNTIECDSGTTGIANRGTFLAATYTGRAGTSAQAFNAAGVVYSSITAVGNVTTGEDDLISTTIAANVLAADHQRIRITTTVVFAANANNKEVKAYWAGTQFYTTGAVAVNGATATFEFIITRTGATTQNITTRVTSGDALLATVSSGFATGAATLSSANVFKLTGEATDSNDIIEKERLTEFLPIAP